METTLPLDTPWDLMVSIISLSKFGLSVSMTFNSVEDPLLIEIAYTYKTNISVPGVWFESRGL